MRAGLNTDPGQFHDLNALAGALRDAGAGIVRFPLVAGREAMLQAFCAALARVHVDPLPVLVRESGPLANWSRLIDCHFWQIGNEEDHRSPSSWAMEPAAFSTLLKDARRLLPNAYIVAGGAADGQPGYFDRVDLGPADALGIHPYGRRPTATFPAPDWGFGPLPEFIAGYKRFGKPIWLTEFGAVLAQFTSQGQRGEYYGRMVESAAAIGCEAAIPFKYEDAGVPGYGMAGTSALPSFSLAVANAKLTAGSNSSNAPETAQTSSNGDSVATSELDKAIDAKMAEIGSSIGTVYKRKTTNGTRIAFTDAGLVIAEPGVPGAYLVEDGPKG